MAPKRRVAVLSGGGVFGAGIAAMFLRMVQDYGYDFERIIGVSVGAIWAYFLAQAPAGRAALVEWARELVELLREIKGPRDVYRTRRCGRARLFMPRALGGIRALHDFTPLREMLARQVDEDLIRESGRGVTIGTVDFRALRYIEWTERDLPLLDRVVASASIPAAADPVIDRRAGLVLFDGGNLKIAPADSAFVQGVDEVVVFSATPMRLGPDALPHVVHEAVTFEEAARAGALWDVERAVTALCGAVIEADVRAAIKWNARVDKLGPQAAAAIGKRHVDVKVLALAEPRTHGCLDFTKANIWRLLDEGHRQGARARWVYPPPEWEGRPCWE